MSISYTKKLPTCVVFKCDFCDMTYGINHNFVLLSILESKHICPKCYFENANEMQEELDGVMRIPCLDYKYTPSSPANS